MIHTLRLAVGSLSQIKKDGVLEGCRLAGVNCSSIITRRTYSGVNEQPVGYEETLRGARNRALAVRQDNPDTYAIGIENGAFEEDGEWEDRGVIVVLTPEGFSYERTTKPIPLHALDVQAAREAPGGFTSTTVGSQAARRLGGNPDDPHSASTGTARSRVGILARTLASIFTDIRRDLDSRFFDLSELETSPKVLVPVGRLTLQLDSVPDAKGRTRPVFDLRGPRASELRLDEVLARVLCDRLNWVHDVVAAEEGADETLARWVARVLRLPLVVFRRKGSRHWHPISPGQAQRLVDRSVLWVQVYREDSPVESLLRDIDTGRVVRASVFHREEDVTPSRCAPKFAHSLSLAPLSAPPILES